MEQNIYCSTQLIMSHNDMNTIAYRYLVATDYHFIDRLPYVILQSVFFAAYL